MTCPPASDFLSRLTCANQLDRQGFARLVFFEGMLFGSRKKWWGTPGERPFAHEGLDLCFFETSAHELRRLDGTINVPALYDGRVEHMTDDNLDGLVKSQKNNLLSFRRKPESSNFNMFWMPDQVRHDGIRLFTRASILAGALFFAMIFRIRPRGCPFTGIWIRTKISRPGAISGQAKFLRGSRGLQIKRNGWCPISIFL